METNSRSPFSTTAPLSIKKRNTPSKHLQGWSLAVKDVIDVAKLPTGAGNPKWEQTHVVPSQHADVVNALLQSGAIVTCKTITDELAYSLNGQNIHFPTTMNCLDEDRLCGGSSSGSAVAVGNFKARLGLGTDTGGSIRVPASYNGLVGFRPTHGAISRKGVVPLAPSFDTLGWITKDIDDAISVGKVLLGNTPEPSIELKKPVIFDCLVEMCDFKAEFNSFVTNIFGQSVATCSSLSSLAMEIAAEAFRVLQGREIWQQHGQWISKHEPKFAQDVKQRFEWSSKLTKPQELAACDQQQRFNQQLKQILTEGHFVVLPTTPGAAPLKNADKNELANYRNKLMMFTCTSGLSGCPQLHLPIFKKDKEAYGISLLGAKHSDQKLLQLGKQIMENYIGTSQ
ncbi:amidase [Aliiglaciecola sp. M165]|uniref:amidase n=1 Tax=Aliiglaciecola sp. M165 TaxID=2593649 RepID=UPI00117C4968|nr:amidase [Aliiglaciecola sp. M165]TRY30126.1 amidase [Aliiglaciecola sp. M165]